MAHLNFFKFFIILIFIKSKVKTSSFSLIGFWDSNEDKPFEAPLYRVAVGKDKLDFYSTENQRYEIERISFDPGFHRNTGRYASDVALIILKTEISFKSYITPVCIPWA